MPNRSATPAPTRAAVRALERRLKRLERALEAAEARYEKKIERIRRAADRRLAAMVQEIATLRHHEARAEVLARRLAEGGAAGPGPQEGRTNGEDPRLPG